MTKKSKIELAVTFAAVVVFVGLLAGEIRKNSVKARRKTLSEKEVFSSHLREIQSKEYSGFYSPQVNIVMEKLKDTTVTRDPFSFAAKDEITKEGGLSLSGILWDEENPRAVINGEILSRGGMTGGKVIVDIEKEKVVLSDGAEEIEIFLTD